MAVQSSPSEVVAISLLGVAAAAPAFSAAGELDKRSSVSDASAKEHWKGTIAYRWDKKHRGCEGATTKEEDVSEPRLERRSITDHTRR